MVTQFIYSTKGNAEMRNLAAPIGINVISSAFVFTLTGLCGNVSTNPYLSICHDGICLPVALISIGTVCWVNGKSF